MWKINKELLPIKAHYFFFFAALGPLLPQLSVFGKQMGVSPHVMGIVTAILPLLWAAAKAGFGYLADYFQAQRKTIFIGLVVFMMGSYCSLYFLPDPPHQYDASTYIRNYFNGNGAINVRSLANCLEDACGDQDHSLLATCSWQCKLQSNDTPEEIRIYLDALALYDNATGPLLVYVNQSTIECSIFNMDDYSKRDLHLKNDQTKEKVYTNKTADMILNRIESSIHNDDRFETKSNNGLVNGETIMKRSSQKTGSTAIDRNDTSRLIYNKTESGENFRFSSAIIERLCVSRSNNVCNISSCVFKNNESDSHENLAADAFHLYSSFSFWGFVMLMSIGTVAFNVANSISDAVCFDILGPDRLMRYGSQRVWGTIGYGITALASGFAVDMVSGGLTQKTYYPAFLLAAIFTVADLGCCTKLKVTGIERHESAGKALAALLSTPPLIAFLVFAVIVGTLDSFIIYYMFWFLEELATEANEMHNIKLLEGISVASDCFGGEVLFFIISGKILKRFGYRHTLTFSLICYSIRLFLISYITSPWEIVIIGFFLQGPTFALGYTTVVGYAAAVAPEGLSATLQGIVAGMDDGVGFTVGSLLGGFLYKAIGGRMAFRVFGCLALVAAILHIFISRTWLKLSKNEGQNLRSNVVREMETFVDNGHVVKNVDVVIYDKEGEAMLDKGKPLNI